MRRIHHKTGVRVCVCVEDTELGWGAGFANLNGDKNKTQKLVSNQLSDADKMKETHCSCGGYGQNAQLNDIMANTHVPVRVFFREYVVLGENGFGLVSIFGVYVVVWCR